MFSLWVSVCVLGCATFVMGVHDFEVHIRKNYDDERVKCMKEWSMDQALIDQVNNGVFPDDKNLKCYMRCLFDALDLFKDDGFLNYDEMLKIIPQDHHDDYLPLVDGCMHIGGVGDICEIAMNLHKCYHSIDSHLHFLL